MTSNRAGSDPDDDHACWRARTWTTRQPPTSARSSRRAPRHSTRWPGSERCARCSVQPHPRLRCRSARVIWPQHSTCGSGCPTSNVPGEATPSDGVDAAAAAAVTTPLSDARRNRGERRRRSGSHVDATVGAQRGCGARHDRRRRGRACSASCGEDDADTREVAVEEVADDPATEVDALEAAEAAEVASENVGDDGIPVETNLSPSARPSQAVCCRGRGRQRRCGDSDQVTADAPGSEQPAPAPEIAQIEIATAEDLAVYGSLAVPALDADHTGAARHRLRAGGRHLRGRTRAAKNARAGDLPGCRGRRRRRPRELGRATPTTATTARGRERCAADRHAPGRRPPTTTRP